MYNIDTNQNIAFSKGNNKYILIDAQSHMYFIMNCIA